MIGRQTGAIHLGQPINWASPLNRRLVAWWMAINQGPYFGGARLLDLCGKNHGTLTNGPTWGGGLGAAYGRVTVDGSDDYVSVGDVFDFTRPFTVVATFRRTNNSTDYQGVIAKRSASLGWWITCSRNANADPTLGTGRVWMSVDNNSLPSTASAIADDIGVVQVAAVFGLSGRFLYVNGLQVSTDAHTANPTGTTAALELGRENTVYLGGDIFELRCLEREYSASDAAAYYQEFRRFYPTTLNYIRLPVVGEAAAVGGLSIPIAAYHYNHHLGSMQS